MDGGGGVGGVLGVGLRLHKNSCAILKNAPDQENRSAAVCRDVLPICLYCSIIDEALSCGDHVTTRSAGPGAVAEARAHR